MKDLIFVLSLFFGIMSALIFIAALVTFLCNFKELAKEVWAYLVMIALLAIMIGSFSISNKCVKENNAKIQKEIQYKYDHRFDNDVVVVTGYPDEVSDKIQEYLNHGYVLQNGSSINKYGEVCQTVIRKK